MQFFIDSTKFVQIGPFSITYYALCIMTGAFLAYYFAKRNFQKINYPTKILDDFFTEVMVISILGARIWSCIFTDFNYFFLKDPIKIFYIWEGGLAIHGGIIAGLIYGYYFTKRKGLSFIVVADAILPTVLIGQAIGRWGNFINKEAHGDVVSESFFNGFFGFLKNGMYIDGKYYFPTFFFESIANVVGFILINFCLRKTSHKRGQLAGAYLMWYGLIRFFIEFYRTDALLLGTLKIAQIISIIILILGTILFFGVFDKILKKRKPTVIFDFDGTLVDSQESIVKSYEYLFEKYDDIKNFSIERRLEVLGPLPIDIIKKYFPNKDSDQLVLEFYQKNSELFLKHNCLMQHVLETLKELKDLGCKIATVSTNSYQDTLEILKAYEVDSYIDEIVSIEDIKEGSNLYQACFDKLMLRTNWYLDHCIFISDSAIDIEAVKHLNYYTVGFYFSIYRAKDLEDSEARSYIKDLREVIALTKQPIHFNHNQY